MVNVQKNKAHSTAEPKFKQQTLGKQWWSMWDSVIKMMTDRRGIYKSIEFLVVAVGPP